MIAGIGDDDATAVVNRNASRICELRGPRRTFDVAGNAGAAKEQNSRSRVDPADVFIGGTPLDLAAVYTVTTNSFVAAGGDNFTVLTQGRGREVVGGSDAEAFVEWVERQAPEFCVTIEGRITVR